MPHWLLVLLTFSGGAVFGALSISLLAVGAVRRAERRDSW